MIYELGGAHNASYFMYGGGRGACLELMRVDEHLHFMCDRDLGIVGELIRPCLLLIDV